MPSEPGHCQGKRTAVSTVNQQEKLRPGCSALQIPDPAAVSEQGRKMLWSSAASSGERWAVGVAASARPQSPRQPTLAVPTSSEGDGMTKSQCHGMRDPNHHGLTGITAV